MRATYGITLCSYCCAARVCKADTPSTLRQAVQKDGSVPLDFLLCASMKDFDEVKQLITRAWESSGSTNGLIEADVSPKTPAVLPELLLPAAETQASAAAYFEQLRRRVDHELQQRSRSGAIDVLTAGICCINSFVQLNVCGPVNQQHAALWQSEPVLQSTTAQTPGIGQNTLTADERWVISQLEVNGEELIGRVQGLELLLAALVTIAEPYGICTTATAQQQQQWQRTSTAADKSKQPPQHQQEEVLNEGWLQQQGLGSWCWWAMRVVKLQQHVLHGKSNTLQEALKQLMQQTLTWVISVEMTSSDSSGEAVTLQPILAAAAHLECAFIHQHYSQVHEAQQQLEAAGEVLGVSVEVTGALGFRTKHQLDAKPQLVAAVKGGAAAAAAVDEGVSIADLGFEQIGLTKELEGMEDDSAVYIAPRLAEDATGNSQQQQQQQEQQQHQRLSCMQQALLLGWANQIKQGTSEDELQQWQMAPFIEAVLQQQHSQYMLHATARLLKCRHEKARGRTRERSLMQLEQLCSALEATKPAGAQRLSFAFAVRFPLWPLLRKELAELYIGMGFVGAALRIFESLEMWDQLIVCYRLLDKKQVAQELVLQRLQAQPDDPKLWCVLGDIQREDAHYLKAWEISGYRSSRSQRSLAHSALQRKEYQQAAAAYELALGLNPLYPDAWFALGYCYLKMGQTRKALQCFTKVTQLEFDHGEAWSNLAALWLQEGGWSEALHASEQAVKYKRDSWQTWDNYATAAVKAQAHSACVRALGQVFELTQGEHLSVKTAEQLMDQLEQEAALIKTADSGSNLQHPATAAAAAAAEPPQSQEQEEADIMEAPEQLLSLLAMSDQMPDSSGNEAAGHDTAATAATARARAYDQVMTLVGSLLKSATNSPACGPAVWGLYARWLALQGQLLSCQEARLKQVRALQSTPFKSNLDHFSAMASASISLCRAHLATTAAGQGGLRDLAAARMHLRGVLKQCEEQFAEEAAYQDMEQLLQEVIKAEEAAVAAKKATEIRG